jgi:hypothetical protein
MAVTLRRAAFLRLNLTRRRRVNSKKPTGTHKMWGLAFVRCTMAARAKHTTKTSSALVLIFFSTMFSLGLATP